MMKQVTLIAPTYVFSPDIEMVYIEQGQKTISYTEIFQYTVSSIPNGQSFNNVLTSGIAGLKELLGESSNFPQFQSPFECAGAGVSGAPEGSISNLYKKYRFPYSSPRTVHNFVLRTDVVRNRIGPINEKVKNWTCKVFGNTYVRRKSTSQVVRTHTPTFLFFKYTI